MMIFLLNGGGGGGGGGDLCYPKHAWGIIFKCTNLSVMNYIRQDEDHVTA